MLTIVAALMLIAASVWAQETTAGLQGTVKDPSGAIIPSAQVVVTGSSLVGSKQVVTDSSGYYHFSNLPPGTYILTVKAEGFDTLKREGLELEVGHLPTVNLELTVGAVKTVVIVNTEGPMIDTTTNTTLTNIPSEELKALPHGTSFQSVIQFSPMARNEPLMGMGVNSQNGTVNGGSGGTSPGNGSNGGQFGFSVGGGGDSENAYLVEGQETANIIGGYSHTNVPMDFIQEVEMKTSGVEAEYGGAMGGVINVIMQKGTDHWHGSIFSTFENQNMDGSPNAFSRYDPAGVTIPAGANGVPNDPNYQNYQPTKDKTADVFPGVTLGGPLFGLLPKFITDRIGTNLKDRVYAFVAFNPEWTTEERKDNWLNYGGGLGELSFSQNQQTYYSYARLDAAITQKIRVFGSWLYQGQEETGEHLPYADSTNGLLNVSTSNAPIDYAHAMGNAAPNITVNTGADITLTKSMVSTTRFGYFFENYHDYGFLTPADAWVFWVSGEGQQALCPSGTLPANCPAWPASLSQSSGTENTAYNSETRRNANKHIQLDEAISWYKSGKTIGTHNVKFGYQLNRESNDIFQNNNTPEIQLFPGAVTLPSPSTATAQTYSVQTSVGTAACQAEVNAYGKSYGVYDGTTGALTGCTGTYGYATVYDSGTEGTAISYNNSFFAQDAWTLGKGLTINAGIRIEKEFLPADKAPGGTAAPNPISFGWGSKIEPRVGVAWDVFQNGKMKAFGEYGVFNDIMKLNLAISSFGGQYWQNCTYLMNSPNYQEIDPTFDSSNRYCNGSPSTQPNYASGTAPSATDFPFVENANYRANEGAVPNIKPYRQHETVFGVDYQLNPNLAFEARWDRRRLDHAIEDAAIYIPSMGGEVFEIVNPGEGANDSFNDYYKYLTGTEGDCTGCQPNPKAVRSYDGLEFSLKKSLSQNWFGTFSYTYSKLRGNYSGLTDSDLADGGGGRNSPNNSRAFDEPFFYFKADGSSANGPLATDRPNTLKGNVSYDLPWSKFGLGKKNVTDFGIFQVAYQGSPLSSYIDVGETYGPGEGGAYFDYTEGRGMWTDVSQNTTTGVITVGNTYARRTPWYTQTDFNLKHTVNLKETSSISFDATLTNLLNQRAVTEYGSEIDSNNYGGFLAPGGLSLGTVADPATAYTAFESPYDWKTLMTTDGITVDSLYGKPLAYQLSRKIRIALHFTF
jgi:hypothetical protein